MNNNFRTMLILGVLFLVLVGVLLLQEDTLQEQNNAPIVATPSLQRVFPELEVLNINAIRLFDPVGGSDFTIARDATSGEWTAPGIPGVLDAQAATFIARTIVLLPYRNKFDSPDGEDLSQYGFRPTGDFYLQFITIDGQQHTVAIGEPTSDYPTFYAVVDEEPVIYEIERAPIDFLLQYFINPPIQ